MPYPNEHASRQRNPTGCERIRRENDKFGAGIHVIWCVRPGGDAVVQSLRFDKDKFTVAEAKSWLKKNGYKTNLEKATGKAKPGT